jgi:hypothetical protein
VKTPTRENRYSKKDRRGKRKGKNREGENGKRNGLTFFVLFRNSLVFNDYHDKNVK